MFLKIFLIISISRMSLTCPFNQCKQFEHTSDPRPVCVCGLGQRRFKFEINSSSTIKRISVLKIMNFAMMPVKALSGLQIRELILTNSPSYIIRNGTFQNIQKLSIIEISNMPNLRTINKGPMWLMTNRIAELRIKNVPSLNKLHINSFKNLLILDISSTKMDELVFTSNPNLALIRVQQSFINNLTISHSPSLSDLYIQNNQIDYLQVNNHSILNYLNIESNILKSTPQLADLFNLRTLILDNNGLDDSIGPLLDKMNFIQDLSIRKNFIKNTSFLISLNNIKNLILSDNLIEYFDTNMVKKNLKFLDLESNLIENDVQFSDSNLEILNLNNNRIKNLIIKNLFYLKNVNLGSNMFNNIEIKNCSNLIYLNVVNSNVSSLQIENLFLLEYLQMKNLNWNTLKIENLPSLKMLDLDRINIEEFMNILSSDSVQGLTVRNSGVENFPYQIFNLYPNLYGIDFGHNNLTSIDNSSLFYGKFVEMANNQISQIENLDYLISYNFYLDLSFNRLGNLEIKGNENSAIEDLLLAGNQIEKVDIIDHPDLIRLNLSHNQIVEFRAQNLSSLKVLDLSFNRISVLDIPDEMANNLNNLNISSNNLSYFNFEKFSNLKTLVARNNFMNSVDFGSFSLNELDLSFNRIRNLSFLVNFPLLKHLNLSGNVISDIDENIFDYNLDLLSIDLSNNFLQKIPSLDKLIYIKYFSMAGQNGRLKYVNDYAFSNRYGNNLDLDLSQNELKSLSKKMLCNKNGNKIRVLSLKIDCGLAIRKCVYQNLQIFLPIECHLKNYRNFCNQHSRFLFYEPISQFCPHD